MTLQSPTLAEIGFLGFGSDPEPDYLALATRGAELLTAGLTAKDQARIAASQATKAQADAEIARLQLASQQLATGGATGASAGLSRWLPWILGGGAVVAAVVLLARRKATA